MDLQKEREEFEAWHYKQYLLENPNIDIANAKYIYDYAHNNALVYQLKESHFIAWQAAKAKAIPKGFVEKTESNTHHYFKLKDWDEWTCIDGIKDAITSDHDINAIVEVECLEVIEINNKPCFALLAFGKRHGTEVKFFDTEEEAIEAQEQANESE